MSVFRERLHPVTRNQRAATIGTPHSTIIALTMTVYALLAVSPVLDYVGWRGVFTVAVLGTVLCIVLVARGIVLRPWFVLTSLVIVITSLPTALHWAEPRYVAATIFLIFSLLLLQVADGRAVQRFVSLSTSLLLLMLVGAWVGFVLALIGVAPLLEIANPDGRPNLFFYTTFSNHGWGLIIRPSGLYDEPGALSFMVCAIAALRHLLNRDSRMTWVLLVLGLITLSLAHLIYVALHLLAERLSGANLLRIAIVLLPILAISSYFGGLVILNERLLLRASVMETGTLVGDNRSWRMLNAAEYLRARPASILFGADPSCRFDYDICKQKFPLMNENPLSPLVFGGIFSSWPYYMVCGLLLLAPLRNKKYLVSFAFGLLLLQRPNLLALGYSLVGLLVLWLTYSDLARRYSWR